MFSDPFVKLAVYCVIAPFWLAWKILVFAWHFVVKPANQLVADKRADVREKAVNAGAEQRRLAREEQRQKQIEALKASLPKTLPDKMRATIQINTVDAPVYEQQRIGRLIADDSFITVESGEVEKYAVDMIVELSETERSLVTEHALQDLVLDEFSVFNQDELQRFEYEQAERATGFKNSQVAELWNETTEDMLRQQKSAKHQLRLGDFLVCPFTRVFDTRHEANQYAQKLKTKILPQIKELMDQYRDYKQTDTIKF